MIRQPIFLHDFQSQPAAYRSDQGAILEWIAAAHAQAEITIQNPATEEEREVITRRLQQLVFRFGCSTDRIAPRAFTVAFMKMLLTGRRNEHMHNPIT